MAAQQIAQLEQARKIVLGDPAHYPSIISGITPIIGSQCPVEAQRWGSEFLAEAFASPVVAGVTKEKMCTEVITLLKDWLHNQNDEAVVRSAIQTAASLYPYVFRHVTNNPISIETWETVSSIKSNILQRWDSAPMGIRICCLKFVQRVVQVQTPGIIADPRRPEQNEISLATVPRDHPILQLPRLEAEASGLLDRLLGAFQDPTSDTLVIDATINCVMVLVRTRQAVSNKIISAVLSFNPFKNLSGPVSAKEKVRMKSLERTIRAFLYHYIRRTQQSQFQARIQQYIDRNIAARIELEGGQSRKRGHSDGTDDLEDAKRQRLGQAMESRPMYPPMPPPPLSLHQLFTLTNDQTSQFDAKGLPQILVQQITVALLQRIDQARLSDTINAVRGRILDLENIGAAAAASLTHVQDEDDYEPEFEPSETLEQVTNRLDAAPAAEGAVLDNIPEVSLGPFKLAQPPPISTEEAEHLARGAIGRVFNMIETVEQPVKPAKAGMNRLAGNQFDNDAWVSLITRLATRAPSNLETDGEDTEMLGATSGNLVQSGGLGDGIRETLFKFIVTDFRHRLSIAISWLCEEWYNEKILAKSQASGSSPDDTGRSISGSYEVWTDRLLESISPYLDAKDSKYLIRFLSEIPELRPGVFERVKSIANDPDRAGLAVLTLHYLALYKFPAKEQALDALQDLYLNYQGANVPARKVLTRLRPKFLEEQDQLENKGNVDDAAGPSGNVQATEPQINGAEGIAPNGGLAVAAAG